MADLSDSDFESSNQDDAFEAAATHIQQIHSTIAADDLLKLYALYKQATVGRCDTPKPGIFNLQAKAKWNAWNELHDMPKDEAKRLYVDKTKQLDTTWYEAFMNGERESKTSWVVHSIEQPPSDLQKNEDDKTVFDFVKEGDLARLKEKLIIQQLNNLDEHGMGLIHWATDRNEVTILEYLLKSGAEVDMRDIEQQTALHYAASCGHIDCIKILINYKADRSLQDKDGQTCVDIAENDTVLDLLIKS